MKRVVYWLIAAVCLCFLLCGCAQNGASDSDATPDSVEATYRQIDTEKAVAMMERETDYIILDVRTQEEFDAGHIPNAVCIPNESIGTDEIPELPEKDQLILVYCRSGRRSKEASQKLADLGYTNIVEFGGINDWTGETVSEKQKNE